MKQRPIQYERLIAYTFGFVLSLVLTITAYSVVRYATIASHYVTGYVILLAITQLYIQLLFFLHIGRDKQQRWGFLALIFSIVVIVIIVVGTLWIMKNLNYNMMPNHHTDIEIIKDQGYQPHSHK